MALLLRSRLLHNALVSCAPHEPSRITHELFAKFFLQSTVLYSVDSFSLMCYYIFDMSYHKEVANSLLFLEKVLLGLPNLQKLSPSALAAVSAMDKL